MGGMKLRVEELVDETVTYSVEKAERMLERISNEKIIEKLDYQFIPVSESIDFHFKNYKNSQKKI